MAITLLLLGMNASGQNYAVQFRSSVNTEKDRVLIPLDAPPKAIDVGGDFTIEFKMKADSSFFSSGTTDYMGPDIPVFFGGIILHRLALGQLGDYGDYVVTILSGRIAFFVANENAFYTVHGQTPVVDYLWHDVAITRSADNGEVAIFVDGELDVQIITGVTGDISYRDDREAFSPYDPFLVIGAEKHDSLLDQAAISSFVGLFDELRISNGVRYNSTYQPTAFFSDDTTTVALYHFDEGAGTIINDGALLAGTNTQGTLVPDVDGLPALNWAPSYIPGCTDAFGANYNATADYDDASCLYPQCGAGTVWNRLLSQCVAVESNCPSDLNGDGLVNTGDLGVFLSGFGGSCN
jgi:hypothetical protein